MTTIQEKASYVAELNGKAAEFEKSIEKRDLRAMALEELMGSGLDGEARKDLHDLFDITVKKKKKGFLEKDLKSHDPNQRKGIETEDVKKYQSISEKDRERTQKAMERVLELKNKLLAKKGPDGKPLFTEEEVAVEIFTPLMREGILPETFIPDEYSETAKMLQETFKLFRKHIETKKEKQDEKEAKNEFNASGGGTAKEMVAAVGKKKVAKQKDAFDRAFQKKLESKGIGNSTRQERARMVKIGMKALKVVKLSKKAVPMIQGLPTEISEALDSLGEQTAGYEFMKGNTGPVEQLAEAQKLADASRKNPSELVFLSNVTNSIESALGEGATPAVLDEFAKAFDQELNALSMPMRKAMAEDNALFAQTMTQLCVKALSKNGMAIGKLVKNITDLKSLESILSEACTDGAKRTSLQQAAIAVASEIDAAICAAFTKANPIVGTELTGSIADEIDAEDWADVALEEDRDKRKLDLIIESVTKAVTKAFPGVVETTFAGAMKDAAERFETEFGNRVGRSDLNSNLDEQDAGTMFKLLIPAAASATEAVVNEKKFLGILQSKPLTEEVKKKAKEENESLEEDYEEMQEELRQFEKELILVDEGGMDIAKQKRIEILLADLQRDRKILEIVESCGNVLRTLGRTIPGIGVAANNQVVEKTVSDVVQQVGAQTFAEEVGAQVTSALNAARLVIQLSVNAVRAAERWAIWYKFQADVEKAYKARSFLLPSIENFFNNKKEQIAYHTIEDAMLAIQLAGSIASTVPEPIAMAVGKSLTTIGKLGQAGNKLGKAIFDENTVRRAWKRTIEAINNPKNRRAGLQAIHDNILLAAHSVAWAATKGDPIAEQILRSCNIPAQTLADDETDAKTIVKYLMVYLADTGKGEVNFEKELSDPEKISLDWKPSPIALTISSWFAAKNRAATLATPLLDNRPTPEIDTAMKIVQAQPTIESMESDIWSQEKNKIAEYQKQTQNLIDLLKKYTPVLPDNSKHAEMRQLTDRFQELAETRLYNLQSVAQQLEKLPWKRATPTRN